MAEITLDGRKVTFDDLNFGGDIPDEIVLRGCPCCEKTGEIIKPVIKNVEKITGSVGFINAGWKISCPSCGHGCSVFNFTIEGLNSAIRTWNGEED